MMAVGQGADAATIARGEQGPAVKEVQELLANQGYLQDKVDGIFGNNTAYAVKAFQKEMHLPTTGTVNSKTLKALKKNNLKFEQKRSTDTPSRHLARERVLDPTGDFKGELKRGARGSEVKALQEKLSINGYSTNGVDGIYGAGTVQAVKAFQKDNKLKVTGIIDTHTKNAIESQRGVPTKYVKKMKMEATAYSAYDPGNGQYTRNGNKLRRGYIAVDPKVIPLGTEVFIEGYGYAVADDIGGAIQGHIIDVAMDSHQEAIQFGRQQVVLYILK